MGKNSIRYLIILCGIFICAALLICLVQFHANKSNKSSGQAPVVSSSEQLNETELTRLEELKRDSAGQTGMEWNMLDSASAMLQSMDRSEVNHLKVYEMPSEKEEKAYFRRVARYFFGSTFDNAVLEDQGEIPDLPMLGSVYYMTNEKGSTMDGNYFNLSYDKELTDDSYALEQSMEAVWECIRELRIGVWQGDECLMKVRRTEEGFSARAVFDEIDVASLDEVMGTVSADGDGVIYAGRPDIEFRFENGNLVSINGIFTCEISQTSRLNYQYDNYQEILDDIQRSIKADAGTLYRAYDMKSVKLVYLVGFAEIDGNMAYVATPAMVFSGSLYLNTSPASKEGNWTMEDSNICYNLNTRTVQ